MPPCDIAAAWLSHTEFAGNESAVGLLSRAIRPQDFALNRDSLPVSAAADPLTAAAILELLDRGQVPTPAAVRTLLVQNEMRAEAERIERLGRRAQRSIDEFGHILATLTHEYRNAHGTGPTRRDILLTDPVLRLIRERVGDIAPNAIKHLWLIERAQRAGWIAFDASPRSLCAARRFHSAAFGNRVSLRPVNTIGTLVAGFLDAYDTEHGRPPRWSVLAHDLRDDRGRRVFNDTADARAQQQWLATAGWLEVRDDLPVPGPRGRRALARKARERTR
ncbi:hypothetical protein IU500_11570 [Nocardia terpenica]|uniref:Uncharacterized protein n=1 Tax=Nocardia terpenica TaxID=455432 RepID=A0A164HK67_9NOCA|nr:hypothetical protein [Nocardia terpenica]KZM68587.1 hypothetical protein AWN90_12130 [Nocardia terpenica]MBF6062593.1 hypothetical protein [Nocardia terpenica]MBF6104681.1 hypothetical protein [Nocardia terpenica]MBF6116484.1 hypothetical protein [Nocardia terpenica]MBF6123447.1 hypothetical protein [Nocardia terpenica]